MTSLPLPKLEEAYIVLTLYRIDDVDIEEMDINWQIAMIAIRMKKFYKKDWKNKNAHAKGQMMERKDDFLLSKIKELEKKEQNQILPQKPEISDSDDNSTEHSTCQFKCSEGSCGKTSEHSFLRLPVQLNAVRQNVNSVRPNVNTGRVNVNSVRHNVNSVRTNVNTGRSKQPVPTCNSNSFSPVRPQDHPLKNMEDRGTSEVTNSAGTLQSPNANASEEADEDEELIVLILNLAVKMIQICQSSQSLTSLRKGFLMKLLMIEEEWSMTSQLYQQNRVQQTSWSTCTCKDYVQKQQRNKSQRSTTLLLLCTATLSQRKLKGFQKLLKMTLVEAMQEKSSLRRYIRLSNALYGLDQAPKHGMLTLINISRGGMDTRRGTIDKTLFNKKEKEGYHAGSSALMKGRFQNESMGELIFFLDCKSNTRQMESSFLKDKTKDEEAADVDVHLYTESMIVVSHKYLTASRPEINVRIIGFAEVNRPLLANMIAGHDDNQVETSEHTFEQPSTEHQPLSPRQEPEALQSHDPSHPHVLEARSLTVEDLLHMVPTLITKVDSLETELKQTKQTMGKAIVKLGRIFKDIDDDPLVSFVTPTKPLGEAHEEEISPTTLEAAKTLSKVASQKVKNHLIKGIKNTKREKEQEKTFEDINSDRGQREGKAPMIVEETQAPKRTKEQIQQEEASYCKSHKIAKSKKKKPPQTSSLMLIG
ncbi:hypothetical protein Tco_0233390 [Tanacetum coccineum]